MARRRLDESLSRELLRKSITGEPENAPDPAKVRVSSTGHLVPVDADDDQGGDVGSDPESDSGSSERD